jgi:2-keto-4-pentenoate hydratase/2-oxohepta-3-ene-1,7-dioic acid hydratase in catechol pathway
MRLATYVGADGDRIGLVSADGLISAADHLPSAPRRMIDLIERWDEFKGPLAALQSRKPDVKLADVRLRAPVPRPGKILAIGLNYKDHIEETKSKTPEFQTWFSKATTAVNGPFDPIALPAASDKLDYEAELVAIIGRRVRGVSGEQAKNAIFGYCVGNDVSVRDWQIRVSQWVLGKSFDTHAPFGPWITTADEIDATDLGIRCLVNGEVRQSSNTKHLLFNCYAQVEHLSKAMTLEPGDVLYTGTPSGVGHALQPPQHLKAGDVVRVEIDQLGALEARVEAEPPQGFRR